MRTLLLTRPQTDSEALAATLAKQEIDTLIQPVITIKYIDKPAHPHDTEAIIITSRHALPAIAGCTLPCYVVGMQTAESAKQSGFHVAGEAATAQELSRILPPEKTFFYPSGRHVSYNFEPLDTRRTIVYEAQARTGLEPDIIQAIKQDTLDGVLFFSTRSAEIFCALIKHHHLGHHLQTLVAYCLSAQVTQACEVHIWKAIRTSCQPTQQSMIELVT
jgi:uroporphyrinogen-III synthase